MFEENGSKYCGKLVNGLKHDEHAELEFDQLIYVGPFENDKKHGNAANVSSKDGTYIYDGPYRND